MNVVGWRLNTFRCGRNERQGSIYLFAREYESFTVQVDMNLGQLTP